MLNEQNDYCIALDQLPKGCYDIRESEGENVLYSVDQGEWSRSARVIIDDARMHEVRILNLNDPRTGTIRIEKLMENEHPVQKNSLAEEVKAKEEYAQAYINFLLGNIIKCKSINELRNYKNFCNTRWQSLQRISCSAYQSGKLYETCLYRRD